MKKISCILIILFTFFVTLNVSAKEVNLYLFHGDGCPHCAEEINFLGTLDPNEVHVIQYEVWYNEENATLLENVKSNLGIKRQGVPVTIIGDTYILGYGEGTDKKIERAISYYQDHEYSDAVEEIKAGTYVKKEKKSDFEKEEDKSDEKTTIDVVGKKINLKNVSLMTSSVLIGLIDGFNPCAMWVLLFLISILMGMKDRRRMWIIGITFLLTSGLVYLLIMFSWLNIVAKMTTIIWVRNLIAIVALIGGIINLRSFVRSRDSGCEVVDDKKRKKIFGRIRKFTSEKSLILAIIGVIGLAVSVNVVELACSAGLPIVFTEILAINNVTGISAFLYTLVYILFFMLDDLLIFFIAMFTMKVTGISTKYNKYSHLIGGIIMLIIGILLLVAPGVLMFNFN
jgi:hypothetical protein